MAWGYALIIIGPMFWILSNSFKRQIDILSAMRNLSRTAESEETIDLLCTVMLNSACHAGVMQA